MGDAGNISFKSFCDLCSDISKSERNGKSEILANFIEKWKKSVIDLKKQNPNAKYSFYPILRFLLPELDRERGAYGVKENTLAKIYIRILCLPKNGNDATKLLEYRVPKSGAIYYDFAEVAHWILKSRCSKGEGLSVNEVNDHLDAIASKHASNDPRGVDAELTMLLRGTSAEEQKWLIRIILKDLKLGLGHSKILNNYHPDAKEFYDSCNDLKKICDILTDRNVRLNEIGIELFSPFRPMLSEECDVSKVDNYLKRSPYFFIETKLDGERFQLHMKQGEFKYFSRNGRDYTSSFGRTRHEGTLTPKLADHISADVNCIILDGEMMCWDSEENIFLTKGMNTDVKNLKANSPYKPCFCVFDILYYNDKVLTNQPLSYRINLLEKIIKPEDGIVNFVARKRIARKEEVWDALNEAIENREEGIVMKDFLSVYKPNVRKNGGWYKLKPEYTEGLMDCLDVIIIGGYYGAGRHKGNISHFLLGVAVESLENSEPEKFFSVARVGSGYSMDELFELQEQLKPHWQKVKLGEMPDYIEWSKEKPDLWINPRDSFILEVKASEIMPSDSFKTGYTLRFPRVEKVRFDKSWLDCITLKEFEDKRKSASGKLVKRGFQSSESDECISPKKKSPRSSITVPAQYRPTNLSRVKRHSDLLSGKEICVFSGFKGYTKADVERKIVENGGTVVQNPGDVRKSCFPNSGINTYCILAEEESSVRISNVVKCKSYDIIKTSYFIKQLISDNMPELVPEVLVGTSSKTLEELARFYDEYGDHYTRFADRQSLEHPFRVIESKIRNERITLEDMYALDLELFSGPSPYSLFRNCRAYIDKYSTVGNVKSEKLHHLEIADIEFRFYGGACTDNISASTTHVILSKKDLTRLRDFQQLNRRRRKKFHIVTEDWISRSLSDKKLQDEVQFYPDPSKTE